jgi:hypothetical protein
MLTTVKQVNIFSSTQLITQDTISFFKFSTDSQLKCILIIIFQTWLEYASNSATNKLHPIVEISYLCICNLQFNFVPIYGIVAIRPGTPLRILTMEL